VCNQRAYKALKRAEKVGKSNTETVKTKNQPIEQLKAKEFLSIEEVCQLVGISRRTVYRLFEQGDLNKIKVGRRTLIRRSALNGLLSNKEAGILEEPEHEPNDWRRARAFDISECYTLSEIQDKYKVSESTIQQLIKRYGIPKLKRGWYAYVPKHIIDELLA
jgi:excisionase family DNA binding protein